MRWSTWSTWIRRSTRTRRTRRPRGGRAAPRSSASTIPGDGRAGGGGVRRARRAARAAEARTLFAALRGVLGEGDLLAYLVMMAGRLVELHRVLAPAGALYLHCDPTASHYLKVVLDVVFGPGTFQNEVIWRYRRWPTRARRFQRMHDVLFYYAKSERGDHTFETLYGYEKLADSTLKTFGTKRQLADFSSGRRKPGITDEETLGPPLSDVWEMASSPRLARSGRGGRRRSQRRCWSGSCGRRAARATWCWTRSAARAPRSWWRSGSGAGSSASTRRLSPSIRRGGDSRGDGAHHRDDARRGDGRRRMSVFNASGG